MNLAATVFTLIATISLSAQITVDGLFDDWTKDTVQVSDPPGDANQFDFTKLIVSSDADDLFIRLETNQPFDLQENNNITLYIDTDDNPATGQSIGNMGADLVWELGQRRGYFNGQELFHNDVGLVSAPTVTSTIFELQLSRKKGNLFSASKVKVLIVENGISGDYLPDNGAVSHEFRNIDYGYSPIPLERADSSHLRIMNYNVLFNGITNPDREDQFARIIKSINPDVIAFNELFDTEAWEVKAFMDEQLPLVNSHGWYVSKVDYGNVTASRFPIVQTVEVYPGRRISAFLVDLPNAYPKDILLINAHLKCCDADETRQDEVDAIAAFYRDIKTQGGKIDLPDGTPFMVLGDLNLVGDRQQLQTLITGDIKDEQKYGPDVTPDWDDSDMLDLLSYHTDVSESFTWWNPESSFYPGRLDFMILPESVLNIEKHFLLRTESMSSQRLQDYGLEQNDTRSASDHLPKVADFTFTNTTGERSNIKSQPPLQFYPNPTSGMVSLELKTTKEQAICRVLNAGGSVMQSDVLTSGGNQIDLTHYPDGLYTIIINMGADTYSRKILKTGIDR